ncbi:MAG: chemotaxis protein CheA, partial [Puniceicoccaceae bacterium]
MNWTPEALKSFENLTSKIAAELVFAQPGKDEGLIPVYSLLNELNESFPEVPVLTEALDGLLAILGTHLDEARPFDRPLLDRLGAFTIWVDNAFTAFSAGQTPPSFEPVSTPASAAADSEEAEPAPGGDSAEEPFREFDCLLQLNLSENSELMPEFYAEAVDHLGQTEAAVLQLEQNPEDTDAINSIFRSFHTIKGVAGFLGLIPINRLSHEVESLLDLVRNGQRSLDGTVIDVVLEAKDVLSQLVSQVGLAIQDGIEPSEIVPVSGLMRRVVLAAASTPAPADSAPETTLPPTPPPETAAGPEATETPSTAPVVPFPQAAAPATPPPATPPPPPPPTTPP